MLADLVFLNIACIYNHVVCSKAKRLFEPSNFDVEILTYKDVD